MAGPVMLPYQFTAVYGDFLIANNNPGGGLCGWAALFYLWIGAYDGVNPMREALHRYWQELVTDAHAYTSDIDIPLDVQTDPEGIQYGTPDDLVEWVQNLPIALQAPYGQLDTRDGLFTADGLLLWARVHEATVVIPSPQRVNGRLLHQDFTSVINPGMDHRMFHLCLHNHHWQALEPSIQLDPPAHLFNVEDIDEAHRPM